MIIYNPLDGDALTVSLPSNARHCFLMTRLGGSAPKMVEEIRRVVTERCEKIGYSVIDASMQITGRDFLLKIWRLIASTPLAIGIVHEEIPATTQANIYYELGVAQALGKETIIVKSPGAKMPSDFIRTEYIEFDRSFEDRFDSYLKTLMEQAEHYELVADQLDRNPILAVDYLKRAYLITGIDRLQRKAKKILGTADLEKRAANSVEFLAASF